MYGQTPPIHIPIWLEIVVWNQLIQAREEVIRMLKFHLKRAQDRMKNQANKHRSDRSFEVGSWVYLKLQPHRQVTARQGPYHKLSAKFYGPFLIEEKIGAVAYRLKLPNGSQIHPVFHVSQLKQCKGNVQTSGSLPNLNDEGLLRVEPEAILERRLGKINNEPVTFVLIKWSNKDIEDATWEQYHDLVQRFPEFDKHP
ncbi:retrotransposable element Tf2 [Tanacetum coccineum]